MSPRRTGPRRQADHVVLISVDALRPEFYLRAGWPAPTAQQLGRQGIAAGSVRSVFPTLTYPAHTTIVTGALPGRHGIWHNRPFNPSGPSIAWYWEAAAIRVPTLWDILHAAGGTTAAVAWPVTVGASIHWNLPDVWDAGSDADPLTSVREAAAPADLFEEIQREATGILRPDEFVLGSLARDDRVGAIAAYLFERYRPALMLVHLIGADHLQHRDTVGTFDLRRAVGAADRAIGTVLEAIERVGLRGRTAVIVTGDHGTSPAHTQLRPNVWLARAGLRGERRDGGPWRASFHGDGGSAFLRVRDGEDSRAASGARAAVENMPERERHLFRVLERDELSSLGADTSSAFALAAVPGVVFSESGSEPALGPATGSAHGYHPAERRMRTGFVAAGAGLRQGVEVPELALEQIAPLLAALLGIKFDAPDGMLVPGLLAD